MPKKRTQAIITVGLFMAVALPAFSGENAPSLEPLQGKWSVTKTNQNGNRFSQLIEIKKDELTFRIFGEDERVRLFAKGTVKAEKAGPFDALILSNIQGGRSEEELEPVDDDRASVYALRDGKLILAMNFDRDRDNERPSIDTYARPAAAKEAAGVFGDGDSHLLGNWKVDVSLGENSYDYVLRISKADGKLDATMVSPRSGDHKCKNVAYNGGELVIELDREIQGNAVTFIYKAKLASEGLSGTVVVKGREDQFNGQWKASK